MGVRETIIPQRVEVVDMRPELTFVRCMMNDLASAMLAVRRHVKYLANEKYSFARSSENLNTKIGSRKSEMLARPKFGIGGTKEEFAR